jgi:hypothetical protein
MRILGNVIWFCFLGGFWSWLIWLIGSLLAFVSIIGIPWGRACYSISEMAGTTEFFRWIRRQRHVSATDKFAMLRRSLLAADLCWGRITSSQGNGGRIDSPDLRPHRNRAVRALELAYVAIVLKRLAAHGLARYLDFARCNTCATQPQLTNVTSGQFCTTVRNAEKL